MTDEQKKYRNQRLIRKRNVLSSGVIHFQGLVQAHERSEDIYGKMPRLEPIRYDVEGPKEPIKLTISRKKLLSMETTRTSSELETQKSSTHHTGNEIQYKKTEMYRETWPSFLKGKIDQLFQSYKDVHTQVSNLYHLDQNFCSNFLQKDVTAIDLQQDPSACDAKQEVLKAYIGHRNQFEKFASLQRYFDIFKNLIKVILKMWNYRRPSLFADLQFAVSTILRV